MLITVWAALQNYLPPSFFPSLFFSEIVDNIADQNITESAASIP